MLKKEIITRVLASLVLVFIVGKILAVVLQSFFSKMTLGGSRKSDDLDRMIERQKEILRARGGLTAPSAHQPQEAVAKKSITETTYQNLLLKSSGAENASAKKMVELFDHLQWGDGKIYTDVQQRMLQRWCIRCEKQDVGQALKWIIAHDLLLKLSPSGPASFDESFNLLELSLFVREFGQSIDDGGSPMVEHQSHQSHFHPHVLIKSMDLLWSVMLGKSEKEILATILKKGQLNKGSAKSGYETLFMKLIVPRRQVDFLAPDRIMSKVRERAFIFDALTPLPPLNGKKDLAGALRIFGLKKMSGQEEVKKIYKDLANRKHPDKLMAKGIPEEWLKLASDNFAIIQSAYDILKES